MTGWIITKLIEYYLNEKFSLHNKFIRLNVLTNIDLKVIIYFLD